MWAYESVFYQIYPLASVGRHLRMMVFWSTEF